MNKGTITVGGNIATLKVTINHGKFELELKDDRNTTRHHQVSGLDGSLNFGPLRETTYTCAIDPAATGTISYEIHPVRGISIKCGDMRVHFGQHWSLWSRLWVFIRPWTRAPREASSSVAPDA